MKQRADWLFLLSKSDELEIFLDEAKKEKGMKINITHGARPGIPYYELNIEFQGSPSILAIAAATDSQGPLVGAIVAACLFSKFKPKRVQPIGIALKSNKDFIGKLQFITGGYHRGDLLIHKLDTSYLDAFQKQETQNKWGIGSVYIDQRTSDDVLLNKESKDIDEKDIDMQYFAIMDAVQRWNIILPDVPLKLIVPIKGFTNSEKKEEVIRKATRLALEYLHFNFRELSPKDIDMGKEPSKVKSKKHKKDTAKDAHTEAPQQMLTSK